MQKTSTLNKHIKMYFLIGTFIKKNSDFEVIVSFSEKYNTKILQFRNYLFKLITTKIIKN